VFWTANAVNAAGQLTQATAGNGVTTNRAFDALTGRLTGVTAGASNSVANLGFAYDALGNLASRSDPLSFGTESFTYDGLNRLLTAQVSGQTSHGVSYNAIGNILTKTRLDNNSLTNSYTYNAPGLARPHAVASVSGLVNGVLNPVYSYDLNGNLTSGAGRTVTWTAFNMVATIVQGATNMSYAYDSEHARITQSEVNGANTTTTTYLNDPASGLSSEKVVAGATTTWTDYLFAGGARVAQRSMVVGGATSLRYFITDHLGSIAVITDGGGAVLERLAYDAWGKRRNTNGSDDPAGAVTSATTRGFTDHEHISSVGLVNMNGRVYDPELGRFLSADPIVPSIFFSQALNRFSYVYNRPLSITDPTGYFGAAEILITAFRFNPVVAVIGGFVGGFLKAIFGGLFGGKKAVTVYTLQFTSSAPSSPAAAAGNPSGLPKPNYVASPGGNRALQVCIYVPGGNCGSGPIIGGTAPEIVVTAPRISVPAMSTAETTVSLAHVIGDGSGVSGDSGGGERRPAIGHVGALTVGLPPPPTTAQDALFRGVSFLGALSQFFSGFLLLGTGPVGWVIGPILILHGINNMYEAYYGVRDGFMRAYYQKVVEGVGLDGSLNGSQVFTTIDIVSSLTAPTQLLRLEETVLRGLPRALSFGDILAGMRDAIGYTLSIEDYGEQNAN
jgi:RHS repeat-associated protein